MGVPTLGCTCAVCQSTDPFNRRTRPSLRIQYNERVVLIDTGPDFHAQALREGIHHVDAVLYTHGHADHLLGFDDLRPLSFRHPSGLDIFADDGTASTLERIFEYTFRTENRYPTSARVRLHRIDPTPGSCTELFGACFQRVPVMHGSEEITGFRFGGAAYLTDMSDLSETSLGLLQDLDVLILDALRHTPHPSHSHIERSVSYVQQLRPRRAFFTHISHDLDHSTTNSHLPAGIELAYDGLQLEFTIAP